MKFHKSLRFRIFFAMLLLLIIPIMIFHRAQAKEMEAKLA